MNIIEIIFASVLILLSVILVVLYMCYETKDDGITSAVSKEKLYNPYIGKDRQSKLDTALKVMSICFTAVVIGCLVYCHFVLK